jgi:DNA-binding MarR family transcriptional regulator
VKSDLPGNPFDSLHPLFHEPHRLAIMSALCAVGKGVSFTNLKEECTMTDGNLNRHLKALETANAVRTEKSFIASKPRTTIHATDEGRTAFLDYLQALEEVLNRAVIAAQAHEAPDSEVNPAISIQNA